MLISIGIKAFEFPKWVEDVYEHLTEEDRANNVKANIYGLCKLTDAGYEISGFTAALSNRVTQGHDANSCSIAIALADGLYPWTFLPGNQTQEWECKHCGFKFATREKSPRCESCKKWSWQKIDEAEATDMDASVDDIARNTQG